MAYDLFFLSYNETNADANWLKFKARFPHAKRVDGVKGIFNAHRTCAQRSLTSHFFVVDADSEILDFDFSFKIPEHDKEYVHLWYARNPVNGLEYGWGGLKLFPKKVLLGTESVQVDMTTSFSLKIIPEVVSITNFNSSPFDTWRSAFRESVKLFDSETEEATDRINGWHSQYEFVDHGNWVTEGMLDALEFALDKSDVNLINDWDWLKTTFDTKYPNAK